MAERYEELRRRALHGEADGFALGLAVLEHQGVVAWIRASADIAVAPARSTALVPVAGCGELVAVLAGMALSAVGTTLIPSQDRCKSAIFRRGTSW